VTLGKNDFISFHHLGNYQCTSCQKVVKKLYSGFCYVCLMKKAAADMCVLNPYQCHFSQGTCREPQWGLQYCYQPHFVYLAFTDKYKVGITRKNQILTRWMDQGATMAAPLALVASRHQSGKIEKTLTEILSDKSHWQKMLKSGNGRPDEKEFVEKFSFVQDWLRNTLSQNPQLKPELPIELQNSMSQADQEGRIFDAPMMVNINYPVPDSIEKIKSVSLEKEKEVKGLITGIKGQYLFFGDRVFNMRNHEGAIVLLENY
jgi:hypothetical protein